MLASLGRVRCLGPPLGLLSVQTWKNSCQRLSTNAGSDSDAYEMEESEDELLPPWEYEKKPFPDTPTAAKVFARKDTRISLNQTIRDRSSRGDWAGMFSAVNESTAKGFPIAPETSYHIISALLAADQLELALQFIPSVQFKQIRMYNSILRYYAERLPSGSQSSPSELMEHLKRHVLTPDAHTLYYYSSYLLKKGEVERAESLFHLHPLDLPSEVTMAPLLHHFSKVEANTDKILQWMEWMFHNEVPIGPVTYHALALSMLNRNDINGVMTLLARMKKTGQHIRSRTIRDTIVWFDRFRKAEEAIALFESLPQYPVTITTDIYLRLISLLSRLRRNSDAKHYLNRLLETGLPIPRFNIVFQIDSANLGLQLIDSLERHKCNIRPYVYTKTLDLLLEDRRMEDARGLLQNILERDILPPHMALPHYASAALAGAKSPEEIASVMEGLKTSQITLNETLFVSIVEKYPVKERLECLIYAVDYLREIGVKVTNASYFAIFQQVISRGVNSDVAEMWEVIHSNHIELTENQLFLLIKELSHLQLEVPLLMADQFISFQIVFERISDAYNWSRTLKLSASTLQTLFQRLVEAKSFHYATDLANRHPTIDRSLLEQHLRNEDPEKSAIQSVVRRISPLRMLRKPGPPKE